MRENEVRHWRDELYREMEYRFRSPGSVAARLRSQVRKLLKYPDAVPDESRPPTRLEQKLGNQFPRRLFDLLMGYEEDDIAEVPEIGGALHKHLNAYYLFRQEVKRFEEDLMTRTAAIIGDRWASQEVWRMYGEYAIPRFFGKTKQEIVGWGNFLNYDVTWDDLERVFGMLSNEPALMSQVAEINRIFSTIEQDLSAGLAADGSG